MSHSSPTVNYFESILDISASLLIDEPKQERFSHTSISLAVLGWINNIFEEAKKFEQQLHSREVQENLHGVVLSNEKFRSLFFAVIDMSCTICLQEELAIECLILIKSILMNFPLIGLHTQEVSEIVRECGLFHLKAVSTVIKKQACEILGLIPPMIGHWISGTNLKKRLDPDEKSTLPAVKEINDIKMSFLRSNHESIKPTDFKVLMDNLLNSPSCNLPTFQTKVLKHLEIYRLRPRERIEECIITNSELQSFWIGYQLSQFCINGKLKTPLGKAQETLTTIEKVIRQLTTNAAAASVQKPKQPLDISIDKKDTEKVALNTINVNECRRLLTFFELLEKTMANAWDGSAYYWASPSGGKPIMSFFKANKKTCLDWLSRLRVTVVQLAFYVGEYGYAARNALIALGM